MPRPRIHPALHAGVAVWPSRTESLPSPGCRAPAPGSFARREGLPSRPLHRIAFMRGGFHFPAAAGNSTISMTPNGQATMQDLQPMRFFSSTWLSIYLANGIIPKTAAWAIGAFTMPTCYCVAFCSCFITVMRGKKRCEGQDVLFVVVLLPSRRPLRRLCSRCICDYR